MKDAKTLLLEFLAAVTHGQDAKLGSVAACTARPLYPQEQTSSGRPGMSVSHRSDLDLISAGCSLDGSQPEALVENYDHPRHRTSKHHTGPSRLAGILDAGDGA